ncbi:MAG: hypothetical protein U5Q03_17905 [Bacteroidota bacterium]|nr:hypothetical protein [Bacteroidota bacterium]
MWANSRKVYDFPSSIDPIDYYDESAAVAGMLAEKCMPDGCYFQGAIEKYDTEPDLFHISVGKYQL